MNVEEYVKFILWENNIMLYLADTANVDEIKYLFEHFPMSGVTTNPTLLARAGRPLSEVVPIIRDVIGDKMLHVQLISSSAEEMLEEAKLYRDKFGIKDLYVKIPVTEQGLKAIKLVRREGIKVTATAVFTQQQALLAAMAGSDFVAPYVNRLDNISGQGVNVVADIVQTFRAFNLPCKVLGASFKNVDQVYKVSLAGCHAVTASPDIYRSLLYHPMTESGVAAFEKDGQPFYDL